MSKSFPASVTCVTHPPPPSFSAAGEDCLVVLHGAPIGRKYDLDLEELTVGRGLENELVLTVDSVSRVHAKLTREGNTRMLTDNGSTNGTWVNDEEVRVTSLANGDLVRFGDVTLKYLAGRNLEAAYHEEIFRMAITDGLTGLSNVRALNEFLEREFARSRRHERALSLLLMDLDYFKRINDELGHLTGDHVLRELASLVASRVRRDELLARYGGEEFVAVLPETDIKGALEFAEILRARVQNHTFSFEGQAIPVTMSIGVGTFRSTMERPAELIREADAWLYEAKRSGRNRVCSVLSAPEES